MSDPPHVADATHRDDFEESPVTMWLRQLESGDARAAQPLYQHFCTRLQALVRQRIPAGIQAVYDDDDASISAFHSLFLGLRQQRYELHDREDFWRLLMTIAERKIAHRIRHELRDKRDVRRVVQNSVFVKVAPKASDAAACQVEAIAGREPTPEFAAEVAETCSALFDSLPDENVRKIALLKLENHTSDEIAAKLGCTRRTVQRKLLVIRRTWQYRGKIEAPDIALSGFSDDPS